MKKYRFLIARRFTQLSILALYILANVYGINILMGNLSSSLVLQTVPLSDPFAVLQMIFAGAIISFDIALGALIISIFYFILGGRAFCSWVCPVNIITDSANYLRRVLKFDEVQKKEDDLLSKSFEDIWNLAKEFNVDLRNASYMMSIRRIEKVMKLRGWY